MKNLEQNQGAPVFVVSLSPCCATQSKGLQAWVRWPLLLALGLLCSVSALAEEAVCVRVKLEIPQRLTFERDAFDASLTLTNNLTDLPLEHIGVQIEFRDMQDMRVDEIFFMPPPVTSVLNGVDGSGTITHSPLEGPPNKGQTNWLIIPTPGAGGILPGGVQYKVRAVIHYEVNGLPADLTTDDEIITVKPQPELVLDYFLPRKVKGDDPFTAEEEPSIPFDLAVRVSNIGAGPARHLRIVSAQPRIVQNDLGLLIDFELIGTFRDDNSIENTLAIPFGTLQPHSCGVGAWAMTTSLLGEFVELDVSFEHSEELGGAKTSLVSATNSHWLIHRIQEDTPGKDQVSDLLAEVDWDNDDVTDGLQVFSSQCGETEAWEVTASSVGDPDLNDPTAAVTAQVVVGWNYFTAADPALGNMPILRVVRQSDQKQLHWRNAWLTENDAGDPLLALADYSLVGGVDEVYEVTYDMSQFDTTPPVTVVEFLGARIDGDPTYLSTTTILTLSALDDLSGVASSEFRIDGGPWVTTTPFYFQSEGAHLLEYRSTDRRGNVEETQVLNVVVDGAAPVVTVTQPLAERTYLSSSLLTLSFSVSDLDPAPAVVARLLPGDGGVALTVINGQQLDLSTVAMGAYELEIEVSDWLDNRDLIVVGPFWVQEQVGGCVNIAEGGPCDDGDACTVLESCVAGVCQGGVANPCDDGDICTDDSCDAVLGCQNVNNTAPCDDGNACTSADVCAGGTCAGASVDCDDNNVCTDDSCDTVLGCSYLNNSNPCDDSNTCTTDDICLNGSCAGQGTAAEDTPCDDKNPCTGPDACDDQGVCLGEVVQCEVNPLCDPALCCGDQAVDCEDNDPCTVDLCSTSGSECIYLTLPSCVEDAGVQQDGSSLDIVAMDAAGADNAQVDAAADGATPDAAAADVAAVDVGAMDTSSTVDARRSDGAIFDSGAADGVVIVDSGKKKKKEEPKEEEGCGCAAIETAPALAIVGLFVMLTLVRVRQRRR